MAWKVIARNKNWVPGATITELINDHNEVRRFCATVDGWRGFKVWQGNPRNNPNRIELVKSIVSDIKNRIAAEDDAVFSEYDEYPEIYC